MKDGYLIIGRQAAIAYIKESQWCMLDDSDAKGAKANPKTGLLQSH
jgi:hypothetical protein